MRSKTFGTLCFSLLLSWSCSIHTSTSSGSQFNQNGWNSSAKLGAQTEKVKNEVPLLILLDFFGCYCFSILFLASHPYVNTTCWRHFFRKSLVLRRVLIILPRRNQLSECEWTYTMHSQSIVIAPCFFKEKSGSTCHSPNICETNSITQSLWCNLFFLFNQHWMIKKCRSAETFQNVWCWGPWQDTSSNHTSSFEFLLWFSHCQIEPGNAHESWPENLARHES